MIYLIRCGATGPVKIGKADDPEARMAQFQTANPEELFLIRTIDGGYREEAWSHQKFRHLHIRSEWFRFDPEMLTFTPAPSVVCRPARPATDAEQIISAFGGLTAMSRALENTPIGTIFSWRANGAIPRWRNYDIRVAAERLQIELPQWFLDRNKDAA